jgi:O-acetyl-ADP-ribose deacetylase (regulator of RNase III)
MSDEVESWLKAFIAKHGGVAGTIHAVAGEVLALRAAVNIPPQVVEVTRSIPSGKGMAGLAWQRDAPVHTCNLKSDETGDVRPGAKAVDASAAVALPVHAEGGAVRGVVGIAWMGERDITERELAALGAEAEAAPM